MLTCNGQGIIVKGHVFNETNNPLPYSSIAVKNKVSGTFANDSGYFELKIDSSDTLVFSSLGFEPISIKGLDFNKYINLKSKVTVLDEVQVTSNRKSKTSTKELGYLKYRRIGLFGGRSQYAFYLPNNSKQNGYIKDITIKIGHSNNKRLRNESMVRIRFYDVDLKTGLPSNDLLKENIILVVNEKQTIINANVSDYYIPFNENGIFIGLDLLGYIDTTGKLMTNFQKDYQSHIFIQYTDKEHSSLTFDKYMGTPWRNASMIPNKDGTIRIVNALFGATVIYEKN